MSIDRTPYNALVDDDGTGTTGTPWNKAAIAGVILDPTDAAIAAAIAGVPIPPGSVLTLLGSASGRDATATANSPAYVSIPPLALGDAVLVSVNAVNAASAPIALYHSVFDPGAGIVQGLSLSGPTGAGAFDPGGVLTAGMVMRQVASNAAQTEMLASGAVTVGVTQSLGATFALLVTANLTQPGGFLYLTHGGVTAPGDLYWAWSVYLLTGTAPTSKPAPAEEG